MVNLFLKYILSSFSHWLYYLLYNCSTKKCAHFLEHIFTQQILWYMYIFFLVHSQLTYYRKKNLNQLPSPTDWKIERKKTVFLLIGKPRRIQKNMKKPLLAGLLNLSLTKYLQFLHLHFLIRFSSLMSS